MFSLYERLCDVFHLVPCFFFLQFFSKKKHVFSRLPVRTLLFQCAVCNHGGHQSCYREYYMEQPMVDLPSSLPQPLTRHQQQQQLNNNNEDDSSSTTSSSQSNPVDQSSFVTESPPQQYHKSPKKLAGHPCAAGCGHFCWAANRDLDDL